VTQSHCTVDTVLSAAIDFRQQMRQEALQGKTVESTQILQHCSNFRDQVLPAMGVDLKDDPVKPIWKVQSAQEFAAWKHEQKSVTERAERQRQQQAELEARAQIPPEALFKPPHCDQMYSAFDEDGIPTHDPDGEVLSKSRIKKLKRQHAKHVKLVNRLG
jgi:cysteinyl-tRNA synthetase